MKKSRQRPRKSLQRNRKQSLLTVTGRDRPGIIAAVTGVLFQHGCNLEDVSMTILEGQFAMILVTALPRKNRCLIEKSFSRLKTTMGLTFSWDNVRGTLARGQNHPKGSDTYLITAAGRDRTGIVYAISRELARRKVNIRDLRSHILGEGSKAVYIMMLEADIPSHFPGNRLEASLRKLETKLSIEIRLKPVERIEA